MQSIPHTIEDIYEELDTADVKTTISINEDIPQPLANAGRDRKDELRSQNIDRKCRIASIRRTIRTRVVGMRTEIRLASHVDIATVSYIECLTKFTTDILRNACYEDQDLIKTSR